jgi:hypothetical protein
MKGPSKSLKEKVTIDYTDLLEELQRLKKENTALKKENRALKEGKEIYLHYKGNEYTVLYDDVYDEKYGLGLKAVRNVIYVGKDGIKWERTLDDFKNFTETGIRRFKHVITTKDYDRAYKLCKCCECNQIAVCTPTFDFYDTEDHGDGILCEGCFRDYARNKMKKDEIAVKFVYGG